MPEKCCVPFCTSNYESAGEGYVTMFRFPTESSRRQLWLSLIGRKNFTPTKNTSVCIKHFEDRFIMRDRRRLRDDKSVFVEPRKTLLLRYDAYPTIFSHKISLSAIYGESSESERPKVSDFSDSAAFNFGSSPILADDVYCDESETSLLQSSDEERDNTSYNCKVSSPLVADEDVDEGNSKRDKIIDFSDFKLHYKSKLPRNWVTLPSFCDIYIAKFDLSNAPQLMVSVRVNSDLTFNVWFKTALVKCDEFQWLFGKQLKLESWTKFECLIQHLNETDCTATIGLQLKSVRKTLEDCAVKCSDKKLLTKLLIIAEHVKFLSCSLPSALNENNNEDFKPSTTACNPSENVGTFLPSSISSKTATAHIENNVREFNSNSNASKRPMKICNIEFSQKRKARKTVRKGDNFYYEVPKKMKS